MTTPNTLKASLTADVGAAQVQIQRLIKTVEDMGKTVTATSAAGQKAFKSEADEVARLVRELGASEKQVTRLEAAKSSFAARVTTESKQAATAAAQMANAYGGATTSVVKGLSNIAAQGKLTAGGLKDVLDGAGSLAFAFGPAGAFVSAAAIATSTIVSLFATARDEMEKTQKEFRDRINDMYNKGDSSGLIDEVRRIEGDLTQKRSDLAELRKPKGRTDIGQLMMFRDRARLEDEIADLERQSAAAAVRARNPAPIGRQSGLLARVTTTANAPGRRSSGGSSRPSNLTPSLVEGTEELRGLTSGLREAMASIPTGENSAFAMIAADAAKPIGILTALRAELEATKLSFKDMGSAAQFVLQESLGAGLDALISGKGNVLQAMKRAAAEPIVAEMKMNAIKDAGRAASLAAGFNFPAAAIALASATKNALGAVAVARLGGINGGGNDAAGGGAGGGGASFGRGASLPGDGLSSARSDKPVKIEMIIVQRTPDGRELARTRQQIQRLDDRNQPIRVTL